MSFSIDNDSWTFSSATPEQVQELFKSMMPVKPPIMAPSLEDRVKKLEEQVALLFKVVES